MKQVLALVCLLLLPALAQAATLAKYTEKTAEKIGDTRLTWLIWDVYDAALYSPTGLFEAQQPYVLELTYLRALDGAQIAEKTREEMARLGYLNDAKLAQWQLQLTDWFYNIKKGTKLAAMRNADGSTTFVRDGAKVLGTIKDPAFTQYFFSIWLSDKTLRPDLRRELLGQTNEVSKR